MILNELFLLNSDVVKSHSPWTENPYKDAAEKNVLGGLSLNGFLSEVLILPV